MSDTGALLVKELREKTGAGFMDCKKALAEANNDLEKAMEHLRLKGLASAAKKAGRAANDGRIHAYIHGAGKLGVMLEVNCETDFVAKTDEFQAFVNNIAMHIAAAGPRFLNKEEVPAAALEKERDLCRQEVLQSGKPANIVDKIVEGKLNKFYEENCLLMQKYVREPDKNVETFIKEMIAKVGENISVKRFVRFQLGEGAKTE